jgi:GNAT superfamily N-acetyltransferase
MITPAQEADGPQLLAITASAGVFTAEEITTVEELWNEYLVRGERASGYTFRVYREGDTVLGYTCYGPRDLAKGAYDLYWIATAPAARHKGVGRALIAHVEEEVLYSGGRLILVETSGTPAYQPTRDFYLSCRYAWEATIHDFYDVGDDLVIFSKYLRSA